MFVLTIDVAHIALVTERVRLRLHSVKERPEEGLQLLDNLALHGGLEEKFAHVRLKFEIILFRLCSHVK